MASRWTGADRASGRLARRITMSKGLAVVTGASSGIGKELAKLCAENGYDVVIAADEQAV